MIRLRLERWRSDQRAPSPASAYLRMSAIASRMCPRYCCSAFTALVPRRSPADRHLHRRHGRRLLAHHSAGVNLLLPRTHLVVQPGCASRQRLPRLSKAEHRHEPVRYSGNVVKSHLDASALELGGILGTLVVHHVTLRQRDVRRCRTTQLRRAQRRDGRGASTDREVISIASTAQRGRLSKELRSGGARQQERRG